MSLWLFAVRYSLDELEVYCHSDPNVFKEITDILGDPQKDHVNLINSEKVPVSAMNKVIVELVQDLKKANKELEVKARSLATYQPAAPVDRKIGRAIFTPHGPVL